MAAPANTHRVTPAGDHYTDGNFTKIAFSANPSIKFWEKTVTPPGIDNGEPIPNDTMFNQFWRRVEPRKLNSVPPFTVTCAYTGATWDAVKAICGQRGSVTVRFPNYDQLDFFGYLKSFMPGAHADSAPPEGTLTIVVTNWDPVNKVEQGWVYTAYTGTGSV